MNKTRVGIVGFRGYSGAELVHLLDRHPHATPVLLEHRADAQEATVRRGSHPVVPCTPEAIAAEGIAAVFLATPAEVSIEMAPGILERGIKVIDLSGAFRLRTPENYARWYKDTHAQPDLLDQAIYGLPEFYRPQIPGAQLVANPGCYPTAANLAIRPLIEAGLVDRVHGIICDAKSGVSGAGRKPSLKSSFCEVIENFSAYSILEHRHVPEILQNSNLEECELSFTAHLLPVDRGILETIYFRTPAKGADEIAGHYERRYTGEPFIRIYAPGHVPDLRAVLRTNFCDIGVKMDGRTGRAVVVVAIDNLVKGAAGQAIQNLNLAHGWTETEGLL
ncbi:MAG TPA: N-acetyl-gamma-glutamyl-phosphate reductase [Bryobacteraceae bacterium]